MSLSHECVSYVYMYVQFSPNLICNMYVTLSIPIVPVWSFGGEFIVGCTVLMLLYFLACGGTFHCQHTLFCVEIAQHHL